MNAHAFACYADAVQEVIYRIEPEHLQETILENAIYPAMQQRYYWTDDWNPAFYVGLARAGFITVAAEEAGNTFLLPEMQEAYAILDWNEVHFSRQIRRMVRSGYLLQREVRVRISSNIQPVVRGIRDTYGPACWIKTAYGEMLEALAALRTTTKSPPTRPALVPVSLCSEPFSLLAVEIHANPPESTGQETQSVLVGGEIGYTIGQTYTSLSGFLHRDLPGTANLGTVQLLALAALLERCGYAFWNLGHPYMQYKFDLGARALSRPDFLLRWKASLSQTPREELSALVGQSFACQELLTR